MSTLAIGSTVWLLDDLRRSVQPTPITGESRTHWAVDYYGPKALKFPKAPKVLHDQEDYRFVCRPIGSPVHVFLTEQAIAEYQFVKDYRHAIVDAVQRTNNADILRQIAALVGAKVHP